MVVAGLIVLAFNRSVLHYILWGILTAYWMIGGVIQDVVGRNSIPEHNALLAIISALCVLYLVRRYLIAWPLWIFAFFVLTIVNDIALMHLLESGEVSKTRNRAYQDICYVLFLLSLLSLIHPVGRKYGKVRARMAYL